MISGKYVETFSDATHGKLEGATRKDPFEFHWVEVIRVENDELICKGAGAEMRLPLKRRGKLEFSEVTMRDPTFGPRPFLVAPYRADER